MLSLPQMGLYSLVIGHVCRQARYRGDGVVGLAVVVVLLASP